LRALLLVIITVGYGERLCWKKIPLRTVTLEKEEEEDDDDDDNNNNNNNNNVIIKIR
jgi:hypothetical protein